MNEKGNLILIILFGMALLVLLLPAVMYAFEPADFIIRIILAFLIFTTVRGYLGTGTVSLLVTGILIYILVIKHAYIAASGAFILMVLLTFGLFSVVVWGIGMNMRGR
ncbi:MAG: hypothetical protein NTZ73_01380 [Candidatus Diapherotrites archaeon]|nr:hypothetical protein [Candidatus Diapherotrites archaeon]